MRAKKDICSIFVYWPGTYIKNCYNISDVPVHSALEFFLKRKKKSLKIVEIKVDNR